MSNEPMRMESFIDENIKNTLNNQTISNVKHIYVLCGGGIAAVNYCLGVLYGLYISGNLLKYDTKRKTIVLSSDISFNSSSGSIIPTLYLNLILINDLHIKKDKDGKLDLDEHGNIQENPDWFKKYMVDPCNKITSGSMILLYLYSFVNSYLLYNGKLDELSRICREKLLELANDVMPQEFLFGKQIDFSSEGLQSQFKYNYIKDSSSKMPVVSNDFSELNKFSTKQQMMELMLSCVIVVSKSNVMDGIMNDAAFQTDNDVLFLDLYKNLQTINYYTLSSFDERTNLMFRNPVLFSTSELDSRKKSLNNYKAIYNLLTFCKVQENIHGKKIKFNLIGIPNKYNPVMKYNNKLYTDLTRQIFFQVDINTNMSYVGIFNGNTEVKDILCLYGMFETLYNIGVSEKKVNSFLTNVGTDDVNKKNKKNKKTNANVGKNLGDISNRIFYKQYKTALDNCTEIYFPSDIISITKRLFF